MIVSHHRLDGPQYGFSIAAMDGTFLAYVPAGNIKIVPTDGGDKGSQRVLAPGDCHVDPKKVALMIDTCLGAGELIVYDRRLPQTNQLDGSGVPPILHPVVALMMKAWNRDSATIDLALMRLLAPWVRA